MLRTTFGTILILLIMGFSSLELVRLKPMIIPVQKIVLKTVTLGSASEFAVLAGTSINNAGNTAIDGDIGLSPGLWVGGFSQDVLVWTQQTNSYKSTKAKLDLTKAYEDAKARKSKDVVNLHGNIGGLTLTPGLYNSTSSLQISSGNLTFDAMGNPNAIFIVQIATTLNTRPESKVFLKRGAKSSNIFWQVGSSATFGSHSVFIGTVMANMSIQLYSGAILIGRGLAKAGEVNLASNKIVE